MVLELLKPEEIERVLVVVAHPDDAEYGLSVAVNNFTAAGKEVGYLLLTAGEAGIATWSQQRLKPCVPMNNAPPAWKSASSI
ncbi:PIG-L deacetylase family protein [Corynebacterium casei]|uniref:PIG-L deacetylase family protein n=1 Tax=Corynebacterium casei TaxID=160386 RepID=UPI003F9B9B5A